MTDLMVGPGQGFSLDLTTDGGEDRELLDLEVGEPVYIPDPFSTADPVDVDLVTLVVQVGDAIDRAKVYDQLVPMATWVIPHEFGRRPVVTVYVGGEVVDPDILASATMVSIVFPSPTVGQAVLN